jgi:hypothetical protein
MMKPLFILYSIAKKQSDADAVLIGSGLRNTDGTVT